MDPQLKTLIRNIIDSHRVMTLATVRPDGWPQATTVGYANDGLSLYFLCGAGSQKAANLKACNKVSLTIDDDAENVMDLKGVSMAATAQFVADPNLYPRIFRMLVGKYAQAKDMPMPDPATIHYLRLTPKVISVLDYSKGFGHADLVDVTPEDIAAFAAASKSPEPA